MKLFMFLVILSAMAWLGSSTPIDPQRQLVNRPRLFRRSPQYLVYVKGQKPVSKEYKPTPPPLRKGQYMCGGKVCTLLPGEVPKGCNGVCQYRVS